MLFPPIVEPTVSFISFACPVIMLYSPSCALFDLPTINDSVIFPLTSFDNPETITFATFLTLFEFPIIVDVSALTISLLKPPTTFLLEFNKSCDLPNTAFCSPLLSALLNPETNDCFVPTFTV